MNTEWVWWVVVLVLVGTGAVAFLALGQVPEIGDDAGQIPEPEVRADAGQITEPESGRWASPRPRPTPDPGAASLPASAQRLPVSTTVPGPDEPDATSDTP
jgi:hypothetical protein